uniref:Uncharacterized protein n=1 Tax=Caenorhabditis japonica TaxID=281687 RepID=A0A8R1E851_CAEJA
MRAFYAKGMHHAALEFTLSRDAVATTTFRIANVSRVLWQFRLYFIDGGKTCAALLYPQFAMRPGEAIFIDYHLELIGFSVMTGEEEFSRILQQTEYLFISATRELDSLILTGKEFKLRCEIKIGIKGSKMVNIADMLNLSLPDPVTNDFEIKIKKVSYFVSKPTIAMQSSKLAKMMEDGDFSAMEEYSDDVINVFLQLLHAVDMHVHDFLDNFAKKQ